MGQGARASRRSAAGTIAAAVFLPLAVFIALQLASSFSAQHADLELETLESAARVNAYVDAQLAADRSALEMLSGMSSLAAGEMVRAQARARREVAKRPRWKNLILTDVAERKELWSTAAPMSDPAPPRPSVAAYLDAGADGNPYGDIQGEPPLCPCVSAHVPVEIDGATRYLLTVELGTEEFQEYLLASQRSVSGISGIVDRKGKFIARTMDYEARLGTSATEYVRNAIEEGDRGVYKGITYEGLRNRTAFETSSLTGWSTHFALPEGEFAALRAGSLGFTLLAAMVALAIAIFFTVIALANLAARRREEERELHSQKMALLGQMSSVVAHDFNNLLAIILGSLLRAQKNYGTEKGLVEIANGLSAAERAVEVTHRLLSFARTKSLDTASVDLRATLENLRPMIEQSLGTAIAVEISVADDARYAVTNMAQLETAILNLAVNARDAMPDGGKFRIETQRGGKGSIDLAVSDTGAGMSRDVLRRAGEPFFTTKADGKGTGLGLAQVREFVTQSGGEFEIVSKKGCGTTVRMRFREGKVPTSAAPDPGAAIDAQKGEPAKVQGSPW